MQARLLQSVEIRGTRTVRKPPPLYNIVTKSMISHCCCDIASSIFPITWHSDVQRLSARRALFVLLLSIKSEPLNISYLQAKVLINHNAESKISVRPFFFEHFSVLSQNHYTSVMYNAEFKYIIIKFDQLFFLNFSIFAIKITIHHLCSIDKLNPS